ncbi:MAG: hypothetical protein QG639_684 [Patescibacteria group bacterium]|nr:hypothetical protein [Patescibacteria group bacterium]
MNELPQEINPGVAPLEAAPAEIPTPMTVEMPAAPEISPTPEASPDASASPVLEAPPEAAPPKFEPVPVTNMGPKVATMEMPALTPQQMAEEVQAEKNAIPVRRSFLGKLFGRGM